MYEVAGTPPLVSFNMRRGENPKGGKTFYVRESSGNNSHAGTDPEYPLADLETAMGKCTASQGDYIFVEYFSTLSAPPLTIDKRAIHLIALSGGNFDSRNDLNGGSGVSVELTQAGRDFELAGFNIGNDDTTYGISAPGSAGMYRFHMHHCTIGNNFSVTDGINGNDCSNSTIDHCMFGSAVSLSCINLTSAVMIVIAHNIFHDIGTSGIFFGAAQQCHLFGNMFAGPIDGSDGWAIDLPVASNKCLVMHNAASECGDATQGTGNPYRDRSANSLATKLNMWAGNIVGNAFGDPKATT